jgi:hypothetical protein
LDLSIHYFLVFLEDQLHHPPRFARADQYHHACLVMDKAVVADMAAADMAGDKDDSDTLG